MGSRARERKLRRLAAIVTILALLLAASAALLMAGSILGGGLPVSQASDLEMIVAVVVFAFAFPVVGWVILRWIPSHRLGWIYLMAGLLAALNLFSNAYVTRAFDVAGGDLPLAAELSWVAVWAWVPGFVLFSTFGILLFPTGRLPSRRWWPVAALSLVAFLMLLLPVAIATLPYRGLPLERAIAVNAPPPPDASVAFAFAMEGIAQLVLLVATIASVAALASRWRRADGVERVQLKWFALGALVDVGILVIWFLDVLGPLPGAVSAIVFSLALPTAIGVAVTRYRLWDIDRVVSRTIAWAIITGVLATLFIVLVLGLQEVLAPVTGVNTLAVATSTLIVAALFAPLRRRVQHVVDRRFDRARYDADRIVAVFADRLRDRVDLATVQADVDAVVRETVAPTMLGLWLRWPEPDR